jgi:hypothetical protein
MQSTFPVYVTGPGHARWGEKHESTVTLGLRDGQYGSIRYLSDRGTDREL